MVPLPVIEEPFQHIAMDTVGPLPCSRQGHRYTLMICDYATRYPDAFPLKTIDAPHVAEELMKFFSWVGVPKEILTEQGMSNCPRKTALIKHEIHTTSSHPIRLPPHRILHAYKDMVQQELGDMLSSGIIEPSKSEWSSPIVLVKKTDGTMRFCINFRRLNSVSQAGAYPMQELIDHLGQARGYWQVPLSDEA